METVIVILIVAAAAIYLFKSFFKSTTNSGKCTCGGGCANCPPPGIRSSDPSENV